MKMNNKRAWISGLTAFVFLASSALSYAAVENLDEMFNRASRRLTTNWPTQQLEQAQNHYIWQPETFMYKDVTTGHEVWKLTNTPAVLNIFHDDITINPWSADGRRLSFQSRRPTQAYNNLSDGTFRAIFMNTDPNGAYLRPPVNNARHLTSHYPLFWSPQIPDVYYQMGENHYYGSTGDPATLYKVTNTDVSESRNALITQFPASGVSIDVVSISSAGSKVMVRYSPWDAAISDSRVVLFPTAVFPEAGAARLDDDGYLYYRGDQLAQYANTPALYYHAHGDTYRLIGPSGDWFFTIPSGGSCHWEFKTVGSASDGGPLYTGDTTLPTDQPPYTFGEIMPHYGCVPNCYDRPYMSHVAFDNWGHYTLFSSVDANPIGPGTWDDWTNAWKVKTFGGGATHHDWHGFTDWTVSSGFPNFADNYLPDRIYAQKFDDAASQQTVVYTHTLYNGGGIYAGASAQYTSLTRPAQSPDGTKVAYHSTFLNGTDAAPDIFWAVVMYPYPPTNLSAASGPLEAVLLNWLPPKYTDRRWIDPATGKIDETKGEVLYAREIKRYHLWRSVSPTGPWQEVGTGTNAEYGNDPVTNTLKPLADNSQFVSDTNKLSTTDNPGSGTWFYALTSEEHSGLESRELSEILQVTVSGGSVSAQVVQAKGQKNFWTIPPAAPTPSSFTITAGGPYRLTWTEPNDSKIRYYNIYYATNGAPSVDQAHRIASVPKGTTTYLDWLADATMPSYYVITSVDRQGNEESTTPPPPPPPPPQDTTPPILSNIASSGVTTSAAQVSWTTDEPADSFVDYGLTSAYGSTVANGSLVNAHSISLSGLSSSTLYHYCVKSKDASGNMAASGDFTFTTLTPVVAPSITSQPVSQTVTVGQMAAFSVTASGTAPLSYQWQKNNVNISGATSAIYTTPATVAGDNASTFRCVVSNSAGTATSNSATLTVNSVTDTTPPVISTVSVSTTKSTATITWVTNEPATSQVEYGLTTGYGSVSALDTNLVTSHSVTLTGLTSAKTYYYRVKSKDSSNNLAVSANAKLRTKRK